MRRDQNIGHLWKAGIEAPARWSGKVVIPLPGREGPGQCQPHLQHVSEKGKCVDPIVAPDFCSLHKETLTRAWGDNPITILIKRLAMCAFSFGLNGEEYIPGPLGHEWAVSRTQDPSKICGHGHHMPHLRTQTMSVPQNHQDQSWGATRSPPWSLEPPQRGPGAVKALMVWWRLAVDLQILPAITLPGPSGCAWACVKKEPRCSKSEVEYDDQIYPGTHSPSG